MDNSIMFGDVGDDNDDGSIIDGSASNSLRIAVNLAEFVGQL
jgi:hypothetical protein